MKQLWLLIVISICLPACSFAQGEGGVELHRSGIVYSIGTVELIANRGAVIDLGDAHNLIEEERVALIRPTNNYFSPVGVVRIADTFPTYCRAHPSSVQPQVGDIAIFVREFWQLETPGEYRDSFLKQQTLKNSGTNSYSTRRRLDTAMTLLTYNRNQPKWEKRSNNVLGYINGASFAEGGEESIERLLNQINMFREHYRVGRTSLPSSGVRWNQVMQVLIGPTAKAQHKASQVTSTEDEFDDEPQGPSTRDITRAVGDRLFDRTPEERNLLAYLSDTSMQESPRRLKMWLQMNVARSQFPDLADEDVVLDVVVDIVRELLENQSF